MNRIVNSICHRISPILFKISNHRVKRNFSLNAEKVIFNKKELLFSNEEILNNLEIRDEIWNEIKHIGDYMWNDLFKWKILKKPILNKKNELNTNNSKVFKSEGGIHCKSRGKKNDWIFIKFNRILSSPYLVEFNAKVLTETTEFQFAFNYQSIGERYRFNLINNKILNFEVVHAGFFHNKIFSIPYSLTIGKQYKFNVIIENNIFSFLVDDETILSVRQKKRIIESGNIALILWDSGTTDIDVNYNNIEIYKV